MNRTLSAEAVKLTYGTTRTRVTPARAIPAASRAFEQKVLALYQRIKSSVPAAQGRIVSIAGMQNTSQGFTYTYELARLAAQQLGKRVLVVSTAGSGFSESVVCGDVPRGWGGVLASGQAPEEVIHDLEGTSIAVTQLNEAGEELAPLLSSAGFGDALQALRDQFDLILIDTPALAGNSDAEMLATLGDGIVLIVDAGVCRWQVLRRTVEDLSGRDVNLLGVVLNKRRFYIPRFIYNKL